MNLGLPYVGFFTGNFVDISHRSLTILQLSLLGHFVVVVFSEFDFCQFLVKDSLEFTLFGFKFIDSSFQVVVHAIHLLF